MTTPIMPDHLSSSAVYVQKNLTLLNPALTARKLWVDMSTGEKLLHIFSLGIWSPNIPILSQQQEQEISRLLLQLKPLLQGEKIDSWVATYEDGSVLRVAEKNNGKLQVHVVQNGTAATKTQSGRYELNSNEANFLRERLPKNKSTSTWDDSLVSAYLLLQTQTGIIDEKDPLSRLVWHATKQSVQDASHSIVNIPTNTPCTFKGEMAEGMWKDVPRNISDMVQGGVSIEGIDLSLTARNILKTVMYEGSHCQLTPDQQKKILESQPTATKAFEEALASPAAIKALAYALSQNMALGARNESPDMNVYQEARVDAMNNNPENFPRAIYDTKHDITTRNVTKTGEGIYEACITYFEPVIDDISDVEISASVARFTLDKDAEPLSEHTQLKVNTGWDLISRASPFEPSPPSLENNRLLPGMLIG